MGVNPTRSNFKAFSFDNTSSRNYGVYITGEGVFNAPERNIEMVEIPGRNGAYALDRGNFNNIEVTYPASIVADTESDFATAVSDLRNFLCSKDGYCRLEDDYNPNEYRMAIYKSGLEVSHNGLLTGEFDITFECKPQRFLTSGETAVSVANGGTLTNPTLFEARPMIEVVGYGDISIGGSTIEIYNEYIGTVVLSNGKTSSTLNPITITVSNQYANSGDSITIDDIKCSQAWTMTTTVTDSSASATGDGTASISGRIHTVNTGQLAFVAGTSATKTVTGTFTFVTTNYGTESGTIAISVAFNGSTTFSITVTVTEPTHSALMNNQQFIVNTITLDSTKSVLGNPLYIDLNIGEAYKIENGIAVSVNNGVVIPAELPSLPSGTSTVTYSNTFSSVKITPRWWKV